ncbi:DNA-binding CsgD family transcriptional regulator [Streptomyces sp. V4I23]|uniref:helix-turn-helix transcriptional regulator n=1 Tax=Streptomyces sp. V4I23 TaxID=3042282 RepID=UPI00277D82F3|nr:helix-turn-helix transcriptional regulator [Streptomyces sp. V4I23]MDQ1007701.1 DNA-binding CsgD family transcriptional regulator [Streptomyces sp. V4I23]
MSSTTYTSRCLSDTTELARAAARLLAADDGDVTCYWNYTSLDDPLIEVLNSSGAHLWDRDGRIRIVYPTAALSEPALGDHIAWQQGHGAEVGHSIRLPPGAMLLTAHGALVTSRPQAGCCYEEVEDAATLHALRALVRLVAQYTEPLPARGETAPTETERQLLDMLMEGLTDRAVARRLGLSERTVRRLVAQLMERLGAASRFEAGARAVERGWIE